MSFPFRKGDEVTVDLEIVKAEIEARIQFMKGLGMTSIDDSPRMTSRAVVLGQREGGGKAALRFSNGYEQAVSVNACTRVPKAERVLS